MKLGELLTREQAAARARVSASTILRWERTGRLDAWRRGRLVYYEAAAVDRASGRVVRA